MGRPKALQWVAKELLHLGSRAAVGSGTVVRRRTPMRNGARARTAAGATITSATRRTLEWTRARAWCARRF